MTVTDRTRQRRWRATQTQRGLVRLQLWVPAAQVAALRAIAAEMRTRLEKPQNRPQDARSTPDLSLPASEALPPLQRPLEGRSEGDSAAPLAPTASRVVVTLTFPAKPPAAVRERVFRRQYGLRFRDGAWCGTVDRDAVAALWQLAQAHQGSIAITPVPPAG